ncbi:MAG: NUDIX hydrolase [Planctomycetota bacterium]|jgi:ADP-ribose pyrophosphatase YjhB (NUDIX family)
MMDLPSTFRSCPKCGSTNLTFRDKAIVCRDCDFVFYHNTAAAVAAIIKRQSEIILVRRAKAPEKGKLDLPGGFVDYGETAEEALRREVYEELNLRIEDIRYLTTAANIYDYKAIRYPVLDILFTCRAPNIDEIHAKDDVAGYEFLKPHNVPTEQLAFQSTKTALAYYIKNR